MALTLKLEIVGNALDIVGANNRLIACEGEVWDPAGQQLDDLPVFWDLATHTFVTFSPVNGNDIANPQEPPFVSDQNDILINLAGSNLAVIQENAAGESVLFFDTSTLPTSVGGG
jgi:hypothetical protein